MNIVSSDVAAAHYDRLNAMRGAGQEKKKKLSYQPLDKKKGDLAKKLFENGMAIYRIAALVGASKDRVKLHFEKTQCQ